MKKILSALLLSAVAVSAVTAQAFYNAGSVTVQNAGSIYVNGDIQITSSGTLANDGSVEIKGNWQNDRAGGDVTYTSTPGKVIFSAAAGTNQSFSSAAGKVVFDNLEVDNPVLGLAGTLYGVGNNDANSSPVNIVINKNLTFNASGNSSGNTAGGLLVKANNITFGVGATITNPSSTNYLYMTTGLVKQTLSSGSSIGQTPTYPILRAHLSGATLGDAYVPANFYLNTIPPQAAELQISFYPQDNLGKILHVGQCNLSGYPGNNIMLSQLAANFGYWQIDVVDGSQTNIDNINGWQYDVTLYPPQSVLDNMRTTYGSSYFKILKIQSHASTSPFAAFAAPTPNSTDWAPYVPYSGTYCDGIALINNTTATSAIASNGLRATALTSFSRFAGGGNSGGSGLPITLVTLAANSVDNQYIQVQWVTETEINNAGFEVQRSTDGINFQNIGWVDGHGNSSEPIQYSLNDKDVLPNVLYYYRLNQKDLNGDTHLSNMVNASIHAENVFTVTDFAPNPTAGSATIEVVSSDVKKATVTIFNTLGQIMKQDDHTFQVGKNTYQVDLGDVAAGTYYVVINIGDKSIDKKLVITR